MTFNELIDLLCYAFIGYVVGCVIMALFNAHLDVRLDEINEIEQRLKKIIHAVKVEKHNGIEYWFDLDSDQFLAQGRTRDEIADALSKRFRGHIFLLNEEKEKGILTGPDFKLVRNVDTKHLEDLLK